VDCPGCQAAMTSQTLEGHVGTEVAIDLCLSCHVFWFDRHESLQLSPGSTLKLFRLIGDQARARRESFAAQPACPRCGLALKVTHDRQRSTPFQYWRCPRGDGRLTTFFDFLREKDFIRPLSPAQVEELRRSVQSVNCSNCGAPVDLAKGSDCAHCGSPLSMLDLEHAKELIGQLQQADQGGREVDPALPLRLAQARREVETAFAGLGGQPGWLGDVSSSGTVGAGLRAFLRFLDRSG
jgi:ribosomal protein S27AE